MLTAAGEACKHGGWQCIAATWGESYTEILGVFASAFLFFLWWLRPALDDDEKMEVREQQRRLVRRPSKPASAADAVPSSKATQDDLVECESTSVRPLPSRRPISPPALSPARQSSPTRQSSSTSTPRALSDSRSIPGSSGTRFYSNVVARAQREHQGRASVVMLHGEPRRSPEAKERLPTHDETTGVGGGPLHDTCKTVLERHTSEPVGRCHPAAHAHPDEIHIGPRQTSLPWRKSLGSR